jgi:RHS repeat-associated protein
VLAYSTSSATFVPLTDVLASTIGLVNSSGTIPTSWKYEPFGVPTVSGAASSYPYLFAGMEYDPTGLYHTYARYYHPRLRRFLSEDPLQFGGGDVNLFGYTGNDPVNRTDPSGFIDVPGGDVNGPNGIADLNGLGSAFAGSHADDYGNLDDYAGGKGMPTADPAAGIPGTLMGIVVGPQGGVPGPSHGVSRNPVGRCSLAAAGIPQSQVPYMEFPPSRR